MSRKTDFILCFVWVILCLTLIISCAIIDNKRLLMSSITLFLCSIGTAIGTFIKYKIPGIKKYIRFFSITFAGILSLFLVLTYITVETITINSIFISLSLSFLLAIIISTVKWLK